MSRYYSNRYNPESLSVFDEEKKGLNQVYLDLLNHRMTVREALEALSDFSDGLVKLAIEAKILLYKDPRSNVSL